MFLLDPDVMWHTATGQWIIEHGTVPSVDVFSHTRAGTPWIDMEWLAQVMMALVYDGAGFPGLIALGSLTVAGTFVLMARYLQDTISPWAAISVALLAIWFSSFHWLMRPHLFAFPILVVWTGELNRAAMLTNSRAPWHLLLLMVLWANLHGSFIVGIAIAIGMGFPGLALASACAALINPYGWGYYEMVLWQYQHMDVMRLTIAELRPVSAYNERDHIAVLLLGATALLWRGVKLPLLRAGLLCGMLFMGLQHWRGLSFFGLVAPLIALGAKRRT